MRGLIPFALIVGFIFWTNLMDYIFKIFDTDDNTDDYKYIDTTTKIYNKDELTNKQNEHDIDSFHDIDYIDHYLH